MNRLNQLFILTLLGTWSFALIAAEVSPVDLENIVAQQRRADALAFGKIGSNNYHLAKARTWLDMATSEYHEADTSGVMSIATTQAETLLIALENNQGNITTGTAMDFPGTEKVRPDLWEKITTIKSKDITCGQRKLGEGEVQLVWAGHEKLESGWSHAEPYMRIAENSIIEAQTAISICNTPVVPATPEKVVPPAVVIPQPAAPATQKITLSGDALFALGQATLNRTAAPSLDDLIERIKKVTAFDEIILVGHTDRLRTDGHEERNQTLSEDRAETVKQYLAGKGIDATKMHASGAGSTQPIVQCNDPKMNKTKLAACLQPNRRVEIIFHGVR